MGLTLKSSAFTGNGNIPSRYTCDGEDVSPSLQWSDIPEGTKSFAIIFDDPDAPAKTWVHWVLYNIPADCNTLKEKINDSKSLKDGSMHGENDFNNYTYNGPCPPGGSHRYFMKLYALDEKLDLKPGATKQTLLEAMEGHILEKTELMGRYQRS